jgi:outer membrane receptor for ferric coprogen and ferric-rhodotorulic acid
MQSKPGLIGSLCGALLRGAAWAQEVAPDAGEGQPETVLIVAEREARTSKGATGLDLSLAETPQSVTVIDRETLDQFGADDVNDILRLTTGVNVESPETDRTYYNARGFDILSMQVDGIGMPIDELVAGALDSALYDKIEVVRGANGLLTGTGNPSGTVNYVRKRPTNVFGASAELTLGAWDRRRVEADVSGPIVESGRWAARAVGVVEDKDTWLDLYHHQRQLFYGVIDGQLGERTTVALGYSQQDSDSDGVLWGALPFLYSDGTQAEFDESATISMRWTYWNVHTDSAFAELGVRLNRDWQLKTVLTYDSFREHSELFWTFPSVLESGTGLGVYGWPGKYEQRATALLSDTALSGAFELWGQRHEATLGLGLARSRGRYYGYPDPNTDADPYYYAMPAFPGWTGDEVPRPAFGSRYLGAETREHLHRLYGALRLGATDALKFVVGFNAIDAESKGFSFGTPADKSERALSPYLGAVWSVTNSVNAYASYSDIYQPQSVVTVDLQPLGSAQGKSYEAGLKGEWFDRKLLAVVAAFKAAQDNLQQFVGYTGTDFIAYYEGINVRSQGYEVELTGRPHDSFRIQAGYTHLSLEDPQGEATRTFIPRDTLKLLATWKVPALAGLELGASLRWQDAIHLDLDAGRIRQGAYAIYGLQAGYRPNQHLVLNATLDNVTDEKHLGSLQWDQAFYGEPRNLNLSATWKF